MPLFIRERRLVAEASWSEPVGEEAARRRTGQRQTLSSCYGGCAGVGSGGGRRGTRRDGVQVGGLLGPCWLICDYFCYVYVDE